MLKREILARVGLSPVCAAQHFQQWTYDEHLPIRAARLTRFAHLWLLYDGPAAARVTERVVIDRLLRALPRHYRRLENMRGPSSLAELMEAVELAEASFAPDAGERAAAPPRRAKLDRRLVEGTSRPISRLAAPAPVQVDEPMPTEPPSPGARAWKASCIVHQTVPQGAPE